MQACALFLSLLITLQYNSRPQATSHIAGAASMAIGEGTESVPSTSSPAPRSWAEDLNTYRATRGSRSFATTTERPQCFGRTCLTPFASTRHPMYSYSDHFDGGDSCKQSESVYASRTKRHGWGSPNLDRLAHGTHPDSVGNSFKPGKAQPSPPMGPDGRAGLWGVLQQTEGGGLDSWVGHPLIQPGQGKHHVQPPPDPKGRKDLFDVIHARNPGMPADDSWLGHQQIDPAKGKRHIQPQQQGGRTDLGAIFSQSILRDPDRLDLLKKGVDPYGDAWVGNILIAPTVGKAEVHGVAASGEVLRGGVFRSIPPGFSDFPPPHAAPVHDNAQAVIQGTAPVDLGAPTGGKKMVPEPLGHRVPPRADLYANMTFRPLTEVEKSTYSRAHNDAGPRGRGSVPHDQLPGQEHGKGPDMLAWKPEEAVGMHVPYGKLAQVARKTKRGIPGGTMGRPMPVPRALSLESTARF